MELNHETATTESFELDALLSEITEIQDEIVEEPVIEDEIVEAAIADVEAIEARQELYASQEVETVESDADKPATEAAVAEDEAKPAKKPKEPKPKSPKLATSKKSEVLRHRLGEELGSYLVFDNADALLDEDGLKAKQDQFLEELDSKLADKVGDKALMLFDWMKKGKGVGELNEVIKRAFNLLIAEGSLTSGDKGNLQLDLLKKPYSIGTARSQSNQIFCLFPALGITVKEKGKMMLNENSVLLDVYKSRVAA